MLSRVINWGRTSLKRRPVVTNTIVYATFYTAAELSQQTFNKYNSPEKPELDLAAAGRIVTIGSCLYAPTLYYWYHRYDLKSESSTIVCLPLLCSFSLLSPTYQFLDRKFVGTSVKVVASKVASDQFIMTPILLGAFYMLMAIAERREDVFEELREKYWKTFVANQAFWIPGQTVNFFFVPSHLRVVYVASASFLWINVLCFIKRQKSEKKSE